MVPANPDLADNIEHGLDLHALRSRRNGSARVPFREVDTFEGQISDPTHLHKYNYAGGNPVSNIDPSGKDFTLVSLLAYTGIQTGLYGARLGTVRSSISAAISQASAIANWTQVTVSAVSGGGEPLTLLLWGGIQQSVEGLLPWVGATLFHDAQVRDWYVRNVGALDAGSSISRSRLKIEARRISSPVGRGIAEYMRPIGREAGRAAGTASKTNQAINQFYARASKFAPALIVVGAGISIIEITTADDPWRQAFREAGSWTGALSVGYAGAQAGLLVGTAIGGPPGGAIGALAGGIAGAIYGSSLGETAGDNYYNFFFDS